MQSIRVVKSRDSGPQIKYLRIPETLLDIVKEDQHRARELGRSARGVRGGRGAPQRGLLFNCLYSNMAHADVQAVVDVDKHYGVAEVVEGVFETIVSKLVFI